MRIKTLILVICIAAGVSQLPDAAWAEDPAIMMQKCRIRAGQTLRLRLPDVDTKYEGQRVDGTHAVNGTAWTKGGVRTFQCSFNRSGKRIVKFILNPS